MDIALHRVLNLAANAKEYRGRPNCPDFTCLTIVLRTESNERAEIKLYGEVDAPFAEIAAAINAAYTVSAAQKEEAA